MNAPRNVESLRDLAVAAHAAGLVALFVAWPLTVLLWIVSMTALVVLARGAGHAEETL